MNNQPDFNSFSLINYIWKWRKLFLIICGAAGVLSFVFSTKTFIRPQFKSTTIIYAPRTNAVSKILMSDNNFNERLDIRAYAVEEETEQMMQILNSREIKDVIIERYDLVNYYGINIYRGGWKAKLYETYDGFVEIKRTKYGAIAIHVKDWNPEQAAKIANDIADELDIMKNKIEKERIVAACSVMENQIAEAERQRQVVADSLKVLAGKGVFAYELQSERVMQQYAIAVREGNTAGMQRLQKELEKLEKWGSIAFSLRQEQVYLSEQVALSKLRLMGAQMDMSGVMPVKFVIEKAIPNDKKVYPKKLIISIISALGAFILTLMTLLIIDKIKREIVLDVIPQDVPMQE
jgi:capsular polysaccharide biosynthesis protein